MCIKPLDFNKQTLQESVNAVNKRNKDVKPLKIPWDVFTQKAFTEGYWSASTAKEIRICTGFLNGDQRYPLDVALGDNHVHALMTGKTGSGKSVALHAIINGLAFRYSPAELQIRLADFKRLEGIKYTKEGALPHAKMITGTSFPHYVLSMFKDTKKEMEFREKLFSFGGDPVDLPIESCTNSQILANLAKEVGIVGVEKIAGYKKYISEGKIKLLNEKILETNKILKSKGMSPLKALPEYMPRILLVVDEFQQLFLIDDTVTDKAKEYIHAITSKGRATGVHLFFISQTMSSTISDDLLGQFDLRFILKSTMDISKDMLGNTMAANIQPGQYVVSEQVTDPDCTQCKLVKIPFLENEEIYANIKHHNEEAIKRNLKLNNLVFFDEADAEQEQNLVNLLSRVKDVETISQFLVGYPCEVTSSTLPLTLDTKLSRYTQFLVSISDIHLYSLLHTELHNISKKDNSVCLFYDSCQEPEADYSYVPNIVYESSIDSIDIFEDLKEKLLQYSDKTVYLVLNKCENISGLDKSWEENEEFISFLAKPPKNVKIIITANKAMINRALLPTFRYVLCGRVDDDTAMMLELQPSMYKEVNKSEYIGLLCDRAQGKQDLIKMFITNNLSIHSGSEQVVIE